MMLRHLGRAVRPASQLFTHSRVIAPTNLTRRYESNSPNARFEPTQTPTSGTVTDSIIQQHPDTETIINSSSDSLGLQKPHLNDPRIDLAYLERAFARFEDRCQQKEEVSETSFVDVFTTLNKIVTRLEEAGNMSDRFKSDISLHLTTLLRCCGKLMMSTPVKIRELHAGNLWTYIKDKNFPVDTSMYNCLIKALNENNTEFDPQKILDELSAADLTPDRVTYQRLIHQYCMRGQIEGATGLLEKMKQLDMSLNEQTFVSLILGYSMQEKPPAIKELFELMNSNGIEPGSKSYSMAISSLVKHVPNKPEIVSELETILNDVMEEEIQFSLDELMDLITALAPYKDIEIAVKFLDLITESASGHNSNTRLLRTLASNGLYERASKLFWSGKPTARAMVHGQAGSRYIRILSEKQVPVEYAMSECSKLLKIGYHRKPFHYLFYVAAEAGRLDIVREVINHIAISDRISHIHYWPLLAQSRTEEEMVETLKNDLSQGKFSSRDLVETFSEWVWPKFGNDFSKLFEINKQLNYSTGILVTSLLNFAVRENKINEVIKFISEAPKDLLSVDTSDQIHGQIEPRERNASRPLAAVLLDQIAEQTKDVQLVEKACALCQLPGEPAHMGLAAAIVKVHLLNDDFDSAMKVFTKFASSDGITPRKNDLIKYCLEKKDAVGLQKLMDIASEIHGENNALFDLACCCIKVGKMKQATKIMTSKDFRISPQRVYHTTDIVSNHGHDISALENYVSLAKNIQGIDCDVLYRKLLDTYVRRKMEHRALELWSKMQEDDFQPSRKILLRLAEVLEQSGIRVPFRKPSQDKEYGLD